MKFILKTAKTIFCLFLILLVIIISSCSDDSSTNPTDVESKNYFPANQGTSYNYELIETDSAGVLRTGTRRTVYSGTATLNSINYSVQIDSVMFGSDEILSESFFRKTSSGVFYFVDTSSALTVIPDSLREFVTLQTEYRFLLSPLAEGSSWPVYRITVRLQSGINFTALDITGRFLQLENIDLNLVTGVTDVTAVKVQYDLEYIQDINLSKRKLTAFAWFSENIGLVKMEGNGVVLGVLLGGELNFDDSTKIITQEIVDYDIK